ncbi:hypothetical protein MBLNU457_1205t2 [Dothideomycetes sp. NU457]
MNGSGKKPLKTYSRKDIKTAPPEVKETSKQDDELTEELRRSISRSVTERSPEADNNQHDKVVSSKKRKREDLANSSITPEASFAKSKLKQRSIKKRVLAKQPVPILTSQDEAWIYASPIHSSIEICDRDQTRGQSDDIEPTPVPSKHSSDRKHRASEQKCRKIRILTLRQQLSLPAREAKSVSARSKSRRRGKSKTLDVIHSPIRRRGIQEGGDGFLSPELLPPSAKKRRLNGRPKASSFYLSETAGLELVKGPLPPVRFLNVFELEQQREGGGLLQLAKSKTVAFEPNITEIIAGESEPCSSRRETITPQSSSNSEDDIEPGASDQASNDETSKAQPS